MSAAERSSVLAVGAVVVAPGPQVLLIRRGQPPLQGAWTLPGGKLREGESIEEAVAREVAEETGIAVDVGPLIDVVNLVAEGYDYVIYDHLCTPQLAAAEPRAGDDAAAARFVAPHELGALEVAPAVVSVVTKALALYAHAADLP